MIGARAPAARSPRPLGARARLDTGYWTKSETRDTETTASDIGSRNSLNPNVRRVGPAPSMAGSARSRTIAKADQGCHRGYEPGAKVNPWRPSRGSTPAGAQVGPSPRSGGRRPPGAHNWNTDTAGQSGAHKPSCRRRVASWSSSPRRANRAQRVRHSTVGHRASPPRPSNRRAGSWPGDQTVPHYC